ncbi:MAG: hypothetical protein LBK50_00950 [Candidatus Nomurabacteria bacterium]|jgi:O-antigen/teichoic acid export membrane protein|nr:hypothetical protein [Candidatus Nomurabacteria bacterium]
MNIMIAIALTIVVCVAAVVLVEILRKKIGGLGIAWIPIISTYMIATYCVAFRLQYDGIAPFWVIVMASAMILGLYRYFCISRYRRETKEEAERKRYEVEVARFGTYGDFARQKEKNDKGASKDS